jgi:hypothetical protein
MRTGEGKRLLQLPRCIPRTKERRTLLQTTILQSVMLRGWDEYFIPWSYCYLSSRKRYVFDEDFRALNTEEERLMR